MPCQNKPIFTLYYFVELELKLEFEHNIIILIIIIDTYRTLLA